MSEQANSTPAADKKPVGRPPSLTEEDVQGAIERLNREGKVVTPAAVQGKIGGAQTTIKRLMAEIGWIDTTINTRSTTPMAIDKVWQQSLTEHSLAIRTECQLKVDKLRDLLQLTFDTLLGVEANFDIADADRIDARRERDELKGQLVIERDARVRAECELAAVRIKADESSKAEAVTATKLEDALCTVQTLQAQALELQRERSKLIGELERERSNSQDATQQAEEHRQDWLRSEAEHKVEAQIKDEHLAKMYSILESLAERDPAARKALTTLHAAPNEDEEPTLYRKVNLPGVLSVQQPPPSPAPD